MDNTEEHTCLSLCSGYGGLELGLKRACPNVRTVAYVEIEAFACENLVAKMEKGFLDAAPVWTDIKTFNAEPFRDRIHIVTAGYPCQPFSVAGKRQGTDDPRHLWPHIERIIETVRPIWFFGENVAGHLAIGFPEVYRSLRNMGYKVEAGLFTAAECGAPHRRERLFILAYTSRLRCDTGWSTESLQRFGSFCQSQQLADTKCTESGQRNIKETQTEIGRDRLTIDHWPARPGQAQYEWEEPKVVGNSCSDIRRRQKRDLRETTKKGIENTKQPRKIGNNIRGASEQRQTQSRLGRTIDGTSCRVDRLRLLGNGVVPQQAEKAFRYLIQKFQ